MPSATCSLITSSSQSERLWRQTFGGRLRVLALFLRSLKAVSLKALDYCGNPFEINPTGSNNGKTSGEKAYGLSRPLGTDIVETFDEFQGGKESHLCGDSAKTDLATESVDAVVTDPPFFDNIHYSQLADFFYVWQRHVLGANGNHNAKSTRSEEEVQQSYLTIFTERLYGVWKECNRVLRREGLLIFTYHHSRNEGWRSVLVSNRQGRFCNRCDPSDQGRNAR